MSKLYKVRIVTDISSAAECEREYPEGTRYLDLAREFQGKISDPILLVRARNRLRELSHEIQESGEIAFVTYRDKEGYNAYSRSLTLMMLKAFADVCGEGKCHVWVHFAVSSGLYCTVDSKTVALSQELLDRVESRMREMVSAAIPFEKLNLETPDARRLFAECAMDDKARLFRYRISSRTNVYTLGGMIDYYYGYMVYDTSYLTDFRLTEHDKGFVLRMPLRTEPGVIPPFDPVVKLFEVQKSSLSWTRSLGLDTVADLNDMIVSGKTKELIFTQEAYTEMEMADIASEIAAAQPDKRLVMIAGPSSSSKTTFSHRLSTQLAVHGLKPHPVPVDNYFKNREDTPRDADGNYDFESLDAIDIEGFNSDMTRLLRGERVEIPTFNFKTGLREYRGNVLELGPNDILVIEGIHALNEKMSEQLPRESKFKIYISALTQLNIDEHNRIPTTDGRLLRRIVRDARTRGTSAQGTIAMWGSVRRGEENNIFPYQESSDVMFNSALVYELAVLKTYAQPVLYTVPEDSPEYPEAKRLLKFLDYFLPIPSDDIPKNSLLREFIGGSCFDV